MVLWKHHLELKSCNEWCDIHAWTRWAKAKKKKSCLFGLTKVLKIGDGGWILFFLIIIITFLMCVFTVINACVRVLSSWIKPRNSNTTLYTTILHSFWVFYCADMSKWSHTRDMPIIWLKGLAYFWWHWVQKLLAVPRETIRNLPWRFKKKSSGSDQILELGRLRQTTFFLGLTLRRFDEILSFIIACLMSH